MNTRDWHENRILWRAGKHNLFEKRCVRFSDLPATVQHRIETAVAYTGRPVFVFYQGDDLWTLLTTDEIVTSHTEGIFRGRVEDIQQDISLWKDTESPSDAKHTSNYLVLHKLGFKVWAPEGNELFALWNILRMFPLRSLPTT